MLHELFTYLVKLIADRCIHSNPFLIYPEDPSLSTCKTETFIAALFTGSMGCILRRFRDIEQLCIWELENLNLSLHIKVVVLHTPLLHRALVLYAISIYTYKYVYHAYYVLLRVHRKPLHLARGSEEPEVHSGLTDRLAQQNGTLTQLG